MTSFSLGNFAINLDLVLPLDTLVVGLISNCGGDDSLGCKSRVSSSSLIRRGRNNSSIPEAPTNPKALSELDASMEQDTRSDFAADIKGVSVSMRFSSDWEAVTAQGATLVGMARGVGVWVPCGTYSVSSSSTDPMMNQFDGATDL